MELFILLTPLILSLLAFFLPASILRFYSVIGSIITLVLTIGALCTYSTDAGYVMLCHGDWIPSLGITKNLGYDGVSLVMLLLTNGLIPLIVLSNWDKELALDKRFVAMVFLMQFGLVGLFLSLDGILFYLFWELTLIPIYLIAWWYGDADRKPAIKKFFIYTFFGSLLMLASIIGLKAFASSFAWESLVAVELTQQTAAWLMAGFLIAFAVKIPLVPFHTWQPNTYTKTTMAGTMLLSGIMLKMALYGLIRWLLPLFPEAWNHMTEVVMVLGLIGVVYTAILAIKQDDMKRLFAYASISHVGLIAAGIMTFNFDTLSGAILQMLNHAVVAVGLFLAVDVIERRTGTRSLSQLGGLAKQAPKFGFWFAALVFAAVSVPFSSGFIGEFLLIKGVYNYSWIAGTIAGTTIILGAVYTFRAYQLSMFGPTKDMLFKDLSWSEWTVFAVIMAVVVFLGVSPQSIVTIIEPSLNTLIDLVQNPTPKV